MDGAAYSDGAGVMDMIRQVTAEAIGMIGKWTVWLGAAVCVAAASAAAQAPNPDIRKPPGQVNRPQPSQQVEPQAEEVPGRGAPQPQPDQARSAQQSPHPQQPQPPPPIVDELLKQIDRDRALAGADISVETVGGQVIITGPRKP